MLSSQAKAEHCQTLVDSEQNLQMAQWRTFIDDD